MKKYFTFLFYVFSINSFAQTATVSAGDISAIIGDSVLIPINVQNFTNVGAITIKIQFTSSVLSWGRALNWDPQLTGALANATNGVATIAWDAIAGMNLSNGKLVDLKFLFNGGSTVMDFLEGQCEIANVNGNIISTTYINGSVNQSYINVTTPNGGENWVSGNQYDITWTDNISENVKIELYKGGAFNSTIITSTPSNGTYSYTIPISQASGSDYKVRITSVNTETLYDESDNNFTIEDAPTITIVSPNGGEIWCVNTVQNIVWQESGTTSNYVNIDYSTNSGTTWIRIFTQAINDGNQNWTIPGLDSSHNRIKITDYSNPSIYDISDADFIIVGAAIDIVSPECDVIWIGGVTYSILWNSQCNVGPNVKISFKKSTTTVWSTIISSTPNDGTYDWMIPTSLTLGNNFKIKVEDATNSATYDTSCNFTISNTTFQLTINVNDGWNMVSAPGVNPLGQGVELWWAGRIGQVFKYNNGYHIVTTTTPGIGYWMKNNGAQTYNTGDEWPASGIQTVTHDTITGASGWNLIGGYELSVTAANVTTNPPGLQSGPIFGFLNGYLIADTLDPGYAYWIKLTSAGQIIIPETLAKDGKPVEYFAEDWGRITLTDATGISYTLYAVKGQVDLSLYELPPAPPTGMFDIRFTSGRIAEDINNSIKAIDMSGVAYPLTVRVEGMDIRMMDESGKMINTNLKSGEDVVISDATIRKLLVTEEIIPDRYLLGQNYPNPFNPSTVILFSVPKESKIKISLYNILGEEIEVLVDEYKQAGKYEFVYTAQNITSGIYLIRMESDDFIAYKKMVYLK